jgi:hypothetical protein
MDSIAVSAHDGNMHGMEKHQHRGSRPKLCGSVFVMNLTGLLPFIRSPTMLQSLGLATTRVVKGRLG